MDNLIGKTLDGLYTIQELIGAGGMANVYKAVVSAPGGPVPEGTVVAVKVLRQELMHDADLVRRFKNESKAISLLNHPNIVKVYDVSVSENLQYIVMECVEGMTLREYLNERGGKITSRDEFTTLVNALATLNRIEATEEERQEAELGREDATKLSASDWKMSATRSFVVRLVRDGIAMMKGDYRKLLRIR